LVGFEREVERVADGRWGGVEVEPAAVGGNRLQRREAALARRGHLVGECRRADLVNDALDPHDRRRLAAGELAELVPARSGPWRWIAVVDEQPGGAGGAEKRAGVLGRVRCE